MRTLPYTETESGIEKEICQVRGVQSTVVEEDNSTETLTTIDIL